MTTPAPPPSSRVLLALGLAALAVVAFLLRTPWDAALWLGPMVVAALATGAATLAGDALLPRGAGPLGPLERLPLALGVGFLVLGTGVFLLAALHVLGPGSVALLLGVLAAAGLARRRSQAGLAGQLAARLWHAAPHPALAVTAVGFLVLAVLGALAPPLYYDALVYHHALPALYLREGGLVAVPTLVHSNFPLLLEMVSTAGLALDGSGVAANLLNLALGLAMFLSLADTGRLLLGERAGWGAFFLALTSPVLLSVAILPTSDLGVAAFAALAANALLRHVQDGRRSFLVLAAVLVGGALASKNVALLHVYPAFLLAVAWAGRGARPVNLGIALVVPPLLTLPTLVKNLLFTGNPFMPALYGLLGGRGWSPEQAQLLAQDAHQAPLTAEHWLHFPGALLDRFVGPSPDLDGTYLGVLLPAFVLAALVLAGPGQRTAHRLLMLAGVQVLFWYGTFVQSRFLGPAALVLALAGGWAWEQLDAALTGRARGALGALLGVGIFINFLGNVGTLVSWQGDFLPVALGLQDRERYVQARLGYPEAGPAARQLTAEGGRVLVVGEARSFHLDAPLLVTGPLDVCPLWPLLRAGLPPAEVEARLRALGVVGVLLRPQELGRLAAFSPTWSLTAEEQQRLSAFLRERAQLVFQGTGGTTLLFRLGPPVAEPAAP